jgi:hypothetical protein
VALGGQDLSSGGIYAQRFDAAGNTVGAEFRVNTTTSGNQDDPAVTALENGGWVSPGPTWADSDVFLQQYDAAGRQLDGQTLVNRYTPSTQNQPAITSMADGGFVVAYTSYVYSSDQNGDGLPDGGNNTQEIRLQRYSNTAPVLTDVFVSGAEDSSIVLTDALFISGFNDPEGQNLAAIKITTLPAEGTLRLDGVDLVAGQEISLAELQAGKLTYQGNANYFGLDQFAWTGSDGVAFAGTRFTPTSTSATSMTPRPSKPAPTTPPPKATSSPTPSPSATPTRTPTRSPSTGATAAPTASTTPAPTCSTSATPTPTTACTTSPSPPTTSRARATACRWTASRSR